MISFGQSQRRGLARNPRIAPRMRYTRRQGSCVPPACSFISLVLVVAFVLCVGSAHGHTGVTLAAEREREREGEAILKGHRYRGTLRYKLLGLPAVDFAVKTTRFMHCIESSTDNKMFADAYKAALPDPESETESETESVPRQCQGIP